MTFTKWYFQIVAGLAACVACTTGLPSQTWAAENGYGLETPFFDHWQLLPAGAARTYEKPPLFGSVSNISIERKENVLVWTDEAHTEHLFTGQAFLLSDKPYEQALAAVVLALAGFGRFDGRDEVFEPASFQGDADCLHSLGLSADSYTLDCWIGPLKSVRLDALDRTPAMQKLLSTADNNDAVQTAYSDNLKALEGLRAKVYFATQDKNDDLFGQRKSRTVLIIFDASWATGRPTTAVSISRMDQVPNPNYHIFSLPLINLYGSGPNPTWDTAIVPEYLFNAVYEALMTQSGTESVRVASDPRVFGCRKDLMVFRRCPSDSTKKN